MEKTLAVLLVCVMLLALLCGCNPAVGDTSDASYEASGGESDFVYADSFFDGQSVVFYCSEYASSPYNVVQFSYDEENAGNVVNDAVLERNNRIEQDLGIKIVAKVLDGNNYGRTTDDLGTLVLGDSVDFDVVCESVDRMLAIAAEGIFQPLNELIDITNPWWDTEAIESISIANKVYFVMGDAILSDGDHSYLTLYNKNLYAENGTLTDMGNIYDIVRDGKFTFDTFYTMSKAVAQPDTDGGWSFNSTYGCCASTAVATVLLNGAGMALAEKTADGGVIFTIDGESEMRCFDEIYDILMEQGTTVLAHNCIGMPGASVSSKYGFGELGEIFSNGNALFYITTCSTITNLKTSTQERDFDFGVVPIPKYTEDQEYYYSQINMYHSTVMGIPISNTENLEATKVAMEALGYYNKDVINAYYVTTLQLQAVDEDDDAEMLDLIFSHLYYDIGTIYNWGGIGDVYANCMYTSSKTLTSRWAAIESAAQAALNEDLELFADED